MQKIKNNWYVLTGGPCSGKTTTINELAKSGYKVVYEAARTLIDRELKKGKTLKEIRRDELEFQKKVFRMKLKIEKKLHKNEVIFLERGIPDSIAYYNICGVTENKELANAAKKSNYKKVFLLEQFKYEKDYARTENVKRAKKIEDLINKSYNTLNIPIIRVPLMSIKERANFIIKNL